MNFSKLILAAALVGPIRGITGNDFAVDRRGQKQRKLSQVPPSSCSYRRSFGGNSGEGRLNRDEAICSCHTHDVWMIISCPEEDSWKFGINRDGLFGLWKPNGDLVKALATGQDELSFSFEDEWMWLSSWVEDSDHGADWRVWCTMSYDDYGEFDPDADVVVNNHESEDDAIVRFGGNAPYHKLMTIDEEGEMSIDDTYCELQLHAEDPPWSCAYVRSVGGEFKLNLGEAVCANSGGGWKFGINDAGTVGLWKPNGNLVRAFATEQDYFYFSQKDEWMRLSSWVKKDGAEWRVFNVLENLEDEDIQLTVDPKQSPPSYDVVVKFGGNPPYHELMIINKGGEMWVDERHVEFIADVTDPPTTCAYFHTMAWPDYLELDQALCGRNDYDPTDLLNGWKFGINKHGTFGLWDHNENLVKAFATNQSGLSVGNDALDKYVRSDGNDWTIDYWKLECDQTISEASSRIVMNPDPERDAIIKFKVPGTSFNRLATINVRGEVTVDENACTLATEPLVWYGK